MAKETELAGGATATIATDSAPPSIGNAEAKEEKSDNGRLVEPQQVREDQVEHAVKFLSHPDVKGSPVVYRRSFLERKGLSREEIDEAFRRVPDPFSDSSPPSEVLAAKPVGTVNFALQTGVHTVTPAWQMKSVQVANKSTSRIQMLRALGVFVAAGAGTGVLTKRYFIPKLTEWIVDVVKGKGSHGKESVKASPTNGVLEAATSVAAAATQAAAAMQDIAKSRSEDRASLEKIIRAVEVQTRELNTTLAGMKDVVQNVEVTNNERRFTDSIYFNGDVLEDNVKGVTNGVRPTSVSESISIISKLSNFGLAPDPSSRIFSNGEEAKSESSSATTGAVHVPHSQSYLDVLAMLERGEKPPGIMEINDKPPNPNQQPSNPRLQPRLKPWEKKVALESQSTNPGTDAGSTEPRRHIERTTVRSSLAELTIGSSTSSSPESWWRKNVDTDASLNTSSVKITEVEDGTGQVGHSSSSSSLAQSGRWGGWVPPAAPLPVCPGAEEAIRRPKPGAGGMPGLLVTTAEKMAASSTSSSQTDESPAKDDVLVYPIHTELPNVPDEQEIENLDRSSTPMLEDLVRLREGS